MNHCLLTGFIPIRIPRRASKLKNTHATYIWENRKNLDFLKENEEILFEELLKCSGNIYWYSRRKRSTREESRDQNGKTSIRVKKTEKLRSLLQNIIHFTKDENISDRKVHQ